MNVFAIPITMAATVADQTPESLNPGTIYSTTYKANTFMASLVMIFIAILVLTLFFILSNFCKTLRSCKTLRASWALSYDQRFGKNDSLHPF